MGATNQVFIITLCFILIGFLIKKYKFLSEADGKIISKFLMHTTFPALMIVSTSRVQLEPTLLLIPLFCILFCGTNLLIAYFLFSKLPRDLRGILTMGAGGLNVGLFGFPIIEGLFGKDALVYAVMFDIGNTIIVFGVVYPIGAYFSSKQTDGVSWRKILKKVFSLPPVHGMFIGLCINLFKIDLPDFSISILDTLAKANKPLVLLLMGIYLSFELNKKQFFEISKVILFRYTVALVLVFCLSVWMVDFPLVKSVLIICIVLPIGLTILPFSDELGYDSRIAGTLVNVSLLVSFVLMWGLVLGLQLR